MKIKYYIFILLISLISGCKTIPSKEEIKFHNIPANWNNVTRIKIIPLTKSIFDLIKNQALKKIINQALQNNYDLKVTEQRLRAANVDFLTRKSYKYPTISGVLKKSRNKDIYSNYHDSYQAGISINWEIDIWRKISDESKASYFNYKSQEALYHQARNSLVARVIQNWIQVVSDFKNYNIAIERVKIFKEIEEIVKNRYKKGLENIEELSTAKTQTESSKANLFSYQETYNRSLRELSLLIGKAPQFIVKVDHEFPVISTPYRDISINIIQNRPDIQAHIFNFKQSLKSISYYKKNLLPQFQISTDILKDSLTLSDLSGSKLILNLVGSVIQSFFEGGRKKNRIKIEKLKNEAFYSDLQSAVLKALKEIEDALGIEEETFKQISSLKIAKKAAKKSSNYYSNRYKKGLATVLNVLIAREREQQLKLSLNETVSKHLQNKIDLALALGLSASFNSLNK